MTRILYSILLVALLAQTSLAASYTFTSTYTSGNFPGGQATVVALGAFDWDTTNGLTNFEFTSVDAGSSGLTLGDYNAIPPVVLDFDPVSCLLDYNVSGGFIENDPYPRLFRLEDHLLSWRLDSSSSRVTVTGSTIVDCPEVPVPSSIAMLGTLAATAGCGTWLKRRRKV